MLVTGGHTEIVLTRGVGLHTVMGITVDIAIGNFLDRCAKEIAPTLRAALEGEAAAAEFVAWHNAGHADDPMPADYFDDLLTDRAVHGGQLIEKLARYGNPATFTLPIPKVADVSANLSYTGLHTAVQRLLFQMEQGGRGLSQYEKIRQEYSLEQVCDLCASIQFAAFFQVQRKVASVLNYLRRKQINITCVNLVGGVSCNLELQYMIRVLAKEYNHEVNACPADLCTDNAAMIAWMGWELKNALQDVDIRNIRTDGHRSIPLGSYVRDHMIVKTGLKKAHDAVRRQVQAEG